MTEKLANLSWQWVALIVASLFLVRYALLKQGGEVAKSIAEIAESLAVAMFLVFFIIRPFLIQAFFIPSGSMHPGLLEDDHILVNKLVYRIWQPKSGDVLVFKAPADWDKQDHAEKDYIKRLIGTPGDTIEVKGGSLMVGSQRQIRADVASRLSNIEDLGMETRCKYLPDGILLNGKKISKEQIAKEFNSRAKEITIVPGRTIRNGKVMDEPYTAEDPDYDLAKQTIQPGHLFVMGDNRNNSNDSHINGQLDRKRVLGKAMVIFWPVTRLRIIK